MHLVKWKEENGYPSVALLNASVPKKETDIKLVEVGHARLNDRRRESLLKKVSIWNGYKVSPLPHRSKKQ